MSFDKPIPTAARRIALCLFVAALLWQMLVLVRFSQSPHFLPSSDDMKFYSEWAERISKGTLSDGQAFYGLPGYAYAVGAVYALAGFDPFLIGLLQTLFFAAMAALIFLLAWNATESSSERGWPDSARLTCGILASLGWTFFVPAQVFGVILMPTIPIAAIYWFCVLICLAPPARAGWRTCFGLGALIGCAAMVIATVLFAVPLGIAAIFIGAKQRALRERWVPKAAMSAVLLVSGLFVGSSPAWVHNYFYAREPVFLSAHSGLNMWVGNNPIANGYPKIPPGLSADQAGLLKDSITLAQSATGKPLKRYEVSKYWSGKADEWIRENFGLWLKLLYVKFENFWNAFQYDDLSTIRLLQSANVVLPGICFGLVAALGLPGLVLMAWLCPRSRWILAGVLLHMAAVLAVFVTERYRLAAVPGLLIGAAFGLTHLQQMLTARRWSWSVGWLVVCAGSIYYVTLPRQDPGFWSLDHYKAGIRSLELGELENARRELEMAYAYTPTSAEINFALGNYWFTSGDLPHAKTFYRAALDLDPDYASAYNNLGVVVLQEKDWDLAARLFQRAISIEPDSATTYYLLATAHFEAGRLDLARKAIAEAVRLKPKQEEFVKLQAKLTLDQG